MYRGLLADLTSHTATKSPLTRLVPSAPRLRCVLKEISDWSGWGLREQWQVGELVQVLTHKVRVCEFPLPLKLISRNKFHPGIRQLRENATVES